jgi:hypothetical protein
MPVVRRNRWFTTSAGHNARGDEEGGDGLRHLMGAMPVVRRTRWFTTAGGPNARSEKKQMVYDI